jgi:hypothetical protein
MGRIITDANSPIKPAFDPYWDAPLTRREAQQAINDMAMNDNVLSNRADTAHVVINLLCEKAGVTPGELEVYVQRKTEEIKALSAKILAEAKQKEAENA